MVNFQFICLKQQFSQSLDPMMHPLAFKVTRRIASFLFGHFNEGIPSFTTFAPSKLNATQCKNDSANCEAKFFTGWFDCLQS